MQAQGSSGALYTVCVYIIVCTHVCEYVAGEITVIRKGQYCERFSVLFGGFLEMRVLKTVKCLII